MAEQRIVVCRTHFIDDRLMAFARSVHGFHGYRVLFAVDEISSQVDTLEFEKISLTREAFEPLELYTEIEDIFWRCGDYCLYLARQRYPHCETFWLIEYDVTINRAEPGQFFRELDDKYNHDFLTSHFRKPEDWWAFGFRMRDFSDDVYRSYFPLVRLSGKALDFTMAERIKATKDIRLLSRDQHLEWPNDESFVATILQNADFRCADYNELGQLYNDQTFWCTVLFHPTTLPPYDGLIYHSVRTGKQYLKLVLKDNWIKPLPKASELLRLVGIEWSLDEIEKPLTEVFLEDLEGVGDNPERVMSENGIILQTLIQSNSPHVLRPIIQALVHNRMPYCLDILRNLQTMQWWPRLLALDNVALAKPAWQSSISGWSLPYDARADAEGANNGNLEVDFGFHTSAEPRPWWTVDLMGIYLLSKVCIHNRRVYSERLNSFRLLASINGHVWQIIYQHPDTIKLEKMVDSKIEIDLQATTRFVRVQTRNADYLHFREFEAYGTLCL